MKLSIHTLYGVLPVAHLCVAQHSRDPVSNDVPDDTLQVAIVGAGITGASAAFHILSFSKISQPFSVTVFESEPRVGGRVSSVSPPDTGTVVEAGAPHFFNTDECLMSTVRYIGLDTNPKDELALPRKVGTWNGDRFVAGPMCDEEPIPPWGHVRWYWKYGNTPSGNWLRRAHDAIISSPYYRLGWKFAISVRNFSKVVDMVSKRWRSFASLRAVSNLSDGLNACGLENTMINRSAEDYLTDMGAVSGFGSDFVQPCTRARFAQDLKDVNGLSAFINAVTAEKVSISQGNIRLIERMMNLSRAELFLNSTVIEIRTGGTRRYKLAIAQNTPDGAKNYMHQDYDIVILTGPVQMNGEPDTMDLLASLNKPQIPDLAIPILPSYAEAHITHFSTPDSLSSTFFSPQLETDIPDDLYTTNSSAHGSSLLALRKYEIAYRRYECHWDEECDSFDEENLYRIVSREHIPDSELARLIGKEWHENQTLADLGITWVHRQSWPRAFPRFRAGKVGIQSDIEIAPNLFYLGGAEEVVSSMEMSCKMGRNVAKRLHGFGSTWYPSSTRRDEL
jgi:hypothetical protein